ncbi:MAG: hypothetical protein WCA46_27710 [Actinocatenispora sp.]
MTADLTTYRHPAPGFTIPLPGDWERVPAPHDGIALVALEPEREPWFRANVVVTTEQLAAEMDLRLWQAYVDELTPRVLTDYRLVDREFTELAARPVLRRLAHHATGRGSVTMEQWSSIHGTTGFTVTASVATLEYVDAAELFAEIASGLRPDPE